MKLFFVGGVALIISLAIFMFFPSNDLMRIGLSMLSMVVGAICIYTELNSKPTIDIDVSATEVSQSDILKNRQIGVIHSEPLKSKDILANRMST